MISNSEDEVYEHAEDVLVVIQLAELHVVDELTPSVAVLGIPGIPESGTTSVCCIPSLADRVEVRCGKKAPPCASASISA